MDININDVLSRFALLARLSSAEAAEYTDLAKLSANKVLSMLDPSSELKDEDKEKVCFACGASCFYKYTLIHAMEEQINVGDMSVRSNINSKIKNAADLRDDALRDIDYLLSSNLDGFYFSAGEEE